MQGYGFDTKEAAQREADLLEAEEAIRQHGYTYEVQPYAYREYSSQRPGIEPNPYDVLKWGVVHYVKDEKIGRKCKGFVWCGRER